MTSNKWWPHDARPTFGSHSGVLDSDSDWDSDSVRLVEFLIWFLVGLVGWCDVVMAVVVLVLYG